MNAPREKDSMLGAGASAVIDGASFLWELFSSYADGPAGDGDEDDEDDEDDVIETEGEEL